MNPLILSILNFLYLLIPMVYGQQRPSYMVNPTHKRVTLLDAFRADSNLSANSMKTDVYIDKSTHPKSTTTDTITSDPSPHAKLRPFYIIRPAHDESSVFGALGVDGGVSNGIITDVYFDRRGQPKSTTKSTIISDGADFIDYLDKLRMGLDTLKVGERNFTLQIFNLEVDDVPSDRRHYIAKNFTDKLWKHVFSKLETTLTVIIMVENLGGYMRDMKFNISSIKHKVKLGWALKNGYPPNTAETFRKFLNTTNIWQAGLSSRFDPRIPHEIIEQATNNRNDKGIKKVIAGVVSLQKTMRELLYYNIDGIVTTDAQALNKVMEETEFKEKYRLATWNDDPFKVFKA